MVLPKSEGTPPVDPGGDGLRSLERWVRKWVRRRVLRRRLPASSAEDVTQEVLLRLLKQGSWLRDADEGRRAAWVRAVTRNVAVDAARRRRRALKIEAEWPGTRRIVPPPEENAEDTPPPEERAPSPDPGPMAEAIAEELREALARALGRLPARYRDDVTCWLTRGETRSGIARRRGRSRFEIARDFAAALALLARFLADFVD